MNNYKEASAPHVMLNGIPDPLDNDPIAQRSRHAYQAQVQTWILQILTGEGGMPSLNRDNPGNLGVYARELDLPILEDSKASDLEIRQALAHKLSTLRETGDVVDCTMRRNLRWLSDHAKLNATEAAIVEFAVCQRAFFALRRACRTWDDMGMVTGPLILSILLQRPLVDVQAALGQRSRLLRSGLVQIDFDEKVPFDRALQMPRAMAMILATHAGDPQELLAHMLRPLQAIPQWMQDRHFAHLRPQTSLVRAWLGAALGSGMRGGHLLVTGAPGLGKTVWVRHWVSEFKAQHHLSYAAFEIQAFGPDGEALGGRERLQQLRTAIAMLGDQRVASEQTPPGSAVIVFDEADDIFEADHVAGYTDGIRMRNNRAFLNDLLETSPVPVVWIMNHHEVLDPAVLRRFDVVIDFPVTPSAVREALVRTRLHDVVPEQECERWGQMDSLTPALVDGVTELQHRAQSANRVWDFPALDVDARNTLVRNRLAPRDARWLQAPLASQWQWDPRWLNPDQPLETLVQGLQRCGQGSVLLYGLPGSGKTRFVQALAKTLQRPLRTVLGSDVLRPYVGETEMILANVFAQAQAEGEVLFLDEVDSLVSERNAAVRSWEVTQVNELLAQISAFRGVLVLATNRQESLDRAVWRRMDVKVELRPMHPQQTWELLNTLAQPASDLFRQETEGAERTGTTASEDLYLTVLGMREVCPGDIATVLRRWELSGLEGTPPLSVLVQWLQQELRHKPASQPISTLNGARA